MRLLWDHGKAAALQAWRRRTVVAFTYSKWFKTINTKYSKPRNCMHLPCGMSRNRPSVVSGGPAFVELTRKRPARDDDDEPDASSPLSVEPPPMSMSSSVTSGQIGKRLNEPLQLVIIIPSRATQPLAPIVQLVDDAPQKSCSTLIYTHSFSLQQRRTFSLTLPMFCSSHTRRCDNNPRAMRATTLIPYTHTKRTHM